MPDRPKAQSNARGLRSDAAVNRESILAAATIGVRRDGEKVPMSSIAEQAGVGIGTLYRHYPTRRALLAALTVRSFQRVLAHARAAALSDEPAPTALIRFIDQTIAARDGFVLPLHGGPVIDDEEIGALQTEIRDLLEQVLARGRREGTIRADAVPIDIILTGAMLAQPLPQVADWDQLARRQASIFVAGLAATDPPTLSRQPTDPPGRKRTRRKPPSATRRAR
jgi:AcrR family transcriptional regulator